MSLRRTDTGRLLLALQKLTQSSQLSWSNVVSCSANHLALLGGKCSARLNFTGRTSLFPAATSSFLEWHVLLRGCASRVGCSSRDALTHRPVRYAIQYAMEWMWSAGWHVAHKQPPRLRGRRGGTEGRVRTFEISSCMHIRLKLSSTARVTTGQSIDRDGVRQSNTCTQLARSPLHSPSSSVCLRASTL